MSAFGRRGISAGLVRGQAALAEADPVALHRQDPQPLVPSVSKAMMYLTNYLLFVTPAKAGVWIHV